MNRYGIRSTVLLFVGISFGLSSAALAQETTTTTSKPTSLTRAVRIDTAQVVYVSGDDVVL
jgi:hypothetical protein